MGKLAEQFIIVCWSILLLVLLIGAFSTKRTVERSRTWQTLSLVAVAVFVLLRWGAGHSLHLRRTAWSPTVAGAAIAAVLTLAGLIVVLWARARIGRNWSAAVVLKENHELVMHGPYAYVRHPMYSGILLMILGTAALYGTLAGFVLFLVAVMGLWIKARLEERLLTKHFPDAYPEYKARVKALIPFVF